MPTLRRPPVKLRLTLFALLSFVVFTGARAPEPIIKTPVGEGVLFIGPIETKDGVTVVDAKPAALILGAADSSNYTAEFEVKPTIKGGALTLTLLANDPESPTTAGLARTDFGREKDGVG